MEQLEEISRQMADATYEEFQNEREQFRRELKRKDEVCITSLYFVIVCI